MKMRIPQNTIDVMLNAYLPECRYLKEAEMEYPHSEGIFRVPKTFYAQGDGLTHLAATELILCYNQLAFSTLAEAAKQGMVEELGKTSLEEFARLQLENMFIIGMNDVRFARPINPEEFRGKITIKQVLPKKNNSLYIIKTNYDFENGNHTGEIDCAIVFP